MYHHPTTVSAADVPITFLLSPIKELDTGSLNNTLHTNSPATIQLAQALQTTGIITASPSLSRIITVNAADHTDTSVVSSQMPVLSYETSKPADSTIVRETSKESASTRRRKFQILSRKESLSKTKSLDTTQGVVKEAVEKRKSDGAQSAPSTANDDKTGEVYV